MIALVFWFGSLMAPVAAVQEPTTIDATQASILRAAGIEFVPLPSVARPARPQRIRGFGVCDTSWERDPLREDRDVGFLAIPGFERFFPGTVGYVEQVGVPWRTFLPSWNPSDLRLVLVQEAGATTAHGRLALSLPESIRAQGIESLTVTEVLSGCGMNCDSVLPQRLSSEPIVLEFSWDLHSAVDPRDHYLAVITQEGTTLPQVPIELELCEPLLEISQAELDFDGSNAPLELAVREPGRTTTRFTEASFPPCLSVDLVEQGGGNAVLQVRETALAALEHKCGTLDVEVRLGSDPVPFARSLRVLHRGLHPGSPGNDVLFGVFLPGETVMAIRTADGRLRPSFPGRMPCLGNAFSRLDREPVAIFQAPLESGPVDFTVGTGERPIRVLGRVGGHLERQAARWASLCGE
jgi:hypothetical protein